MSGSVSGSRSSSISQNPYPPYYQDAVRIFVQQQSGSGDCAEAGLGSSSRRFSVDPQLTNFDILRNLIGRAFDMKGDFAISYRAFDDYGLETYLPLVSDWDLSAAFLSASDPDLQLMIEPKTIPLDIDVEDEEEPWDIIRSTEVIRDASQKSPLVNPNTTNPNDSKADTTSGVHHGHHRNNHNFQHNVNSSPNPSLQRTGNNPNSNNNSSKVFTAMSQLGGAVNQYPLGLNTKINTAGIFNTMEKWVQKAKTFVEDLSVVTSRPPLSDVEFRNYLDPGGVLCRPRELRYACYHGGIEPGLRKVVWKHLLNIYPDGLSGNARMDYVRNKSKDYYELRDAWKSAVQNGQVSEDILCVSNMVRKDVLRTDRHLQFFAGQDDNQNIGILFNILTTYALNHPSVGYCQGMSDLASPLLVTMGDEAQAYICFCSLMDRIKPNFNYDGMAMSLKFTHLSEALAYYDGIFWSYLKSIGADDLLFCYRWLLLEMKREFAFEDALRMMEVLWASLPYKPQDVPLYEVKFTLSNANSIPIPVPTLTASYSRVCAIRRSSTSVGSNEINNRRLSRKPKANPLSLDENSLTSMSSISSSYKSHSKPFYSLDETMEILSASDFTTSSPFEILSLNSSTPPQKPKLIKNLREFWTIGKSKNSEESENSTPFSANSSKSSTVSNFESIQNLDADLNGQVFFDDPEVPVPHPQVIQSQNLSNLQSSSNSITMMQTPPPPLPQQEPQPAIMELNLKSEKSEEKENSRTLTSTKPNSQYDDHVFTPEDQNQRKKVSGSGASCDVLPDAERRSQISAADSEHDSGHCYGESMEIFENSLQEPEFQLGHTNSRQTAKMPTPESLGGGNPFLMFLCLTLLLQHRDHIIRNGMDYNETAMYFDKMIRKHNVGRVLAHARMLYSEYLKQNVTRA